MNVRTSSPALPFRAVARLAPSFPPPNIISSKAFKASSTLSPPFNLFMNLSTPPLILARCPIPPENPLLSKPLLTPSVTSSAFDSAFAAPLLLTPPVKALQTDRNAPTLKLGIPPPRCFLIVDMGSQPSARELFTTFA